MNIVVRSCPLPLLSSGGTLDSPVDQNQKLHRLLYTHIATADESPSVELPPEVRRPLVDTRRNAALACKHNPHSESDLRRTFLVMSLSKSNLPRHQPRQQRIPLLGECTGCVDCRRTGGDVVGAQFEVAVWTSAPRGILAMQVVGVRLGRLSGLGSAPGCRIRRHSEAWRVCSRVRAKDMLPGP